MRMPPSPADFIHARACKLKCEKILTRPSFYASVECLEHGLDPMTTNLVVADAGCTEKTICLAISPSLKSCGIPGRARLFKVKQAGQRAAAAI